MPTKKTLVYIALASLTLAAAYFVMHSSDKPAPAVEKPIMYSTDTPDEEKPPADYQWRGGPSDPKMISLPSIKAEGYVQKVSIDQKKAVAVPNNIHMAGWFVDYQAPGAPGLSIIDGHVNGRKNSGIFKDLAKLKKGDQFSIEFGNGTKKTFEVDEVVSVKTEESAAVLFSQKPGIARQLNLITCGGTFNRAKQQYDQRVIAIAKLK